MNADLIRVRDQRGSSYGAGAAAVACVLFVGSEVIFLLDFECGDRVAVAGEVEKAC